MAQVFISHASGDRDVIDSEIRPLLESRGLSTWCSEHDIPGATRFEVDIRKALAESEWFLVVMSSDSCKSRWVQREVHWAMEERHDRFVPVMIEPCDFNDWHIGIREIQVVDFTEPTDVAKRALLAAFGLTMSGPETQPPWDAPAEEPAPVLSSDHIALTGFDYFCYISQSKVEQLFVQIPAEEVRRAADDEAIVARMADLNKRITSGRDDPSVRLADLEQELVWLQTARRLTGLTFGKHQQGIAESRPSGGTDTSDLVTRTRTVLRHIMMHKSIRNLERAVGDGAKLDAFCYAYEGPHRFEGFAGPGMAIISSPVGNRTLRQYCSLRYFSDMDLKTGHDGRPEAHPHSLNFPFFQKESGIAYTMISFLLITGLREAIIFGSPICMILDSRKGIPL